MIVWNEPLWSGTEIVGNSVVRATEEDVIKYWRATHPVYEYTDEEALYSFMSTHWAWKKEQNIVDDFTTFIVIVLAIYFFPTLIAGIRRHPQEWPIFFTNLFFGWSVIGWCVCFVWAIWSFKK